MTLSTSSPLPAQPRLEPLDGGGLRVFAPAKLNLNLLVGPRGQDGYHGLDSLVAKVTLYDCVEVRVVPGGGDSLRCDGADCGPPEGNLARRAARLLRESCGWREGAEIVLHKSIPPGKGLGGGSSDAAAVLAALNELYGRPLGEGDLLALAARLGSDVPLFLGPPAVRMTGRGERLAPLRVHPFFAALVLPDCQCATPAVYRAFDESPAAPGEQIAEEALTAPPSAWRGRMRNDLAAAARKVCPELGDLWDDLSAVVGAPVQLTGSGSGLFVLCDDAAEAEAVLSAMRPRLRAHGGAHGLVVRASPW